jgi:hypothetical protein
MWDDFLLTLLAYLSCISYLLVKDVANDGRDDGRRRRRRRRRRRGDARYWGSHGCARRWDGERWREECRRRRGRGGSE